MITRSLNATHSNITPQTPSHWNPFLVPGLREKKRNYVIWFIGGAEGHFVCACSVLDDLMKVAADMRLQSARTRQFPASFQLNRTHEKDKQRNGDVRKS